MWCNRPVEEVALEMQEVAAEVEERRLEQRRCRRPTHHAAWAVAKTRVWKKKHPL